MKRLLVVLVGLLAACGSKKQDARCSAFAERVVTCAFDTSVTPAMTEAEKKSVGGIAYGVCTKTNKDEAALHYYGDVDKKIACMEGKDCAGVRACLTADAPYRASR